MAEGGRATQQAKKHDLNSPDTETTQLKKQRYLSTEQKILAGYALPTSSAWMARSIHAQPCTHSCSRSTCLMTTSSCHWSTA